MSLFVDDALLHMYNSKDTAKTLIFNCSKLTVEENIKNHLEMIICFVNGLKSHLTWGEGMPNTGNLDSYLGLVKSWILEDNQKLPLY